MPTVYFTIRVLSIYVEFFTQLGLCCIGGAENAGQDIAGQDNDRQEKHHA